MIKIELKPLKAGIWCWRVSYGNRAACNKTASKEEANRQIKDVIEWVANGYE